MLQELADLGFKYVELSHGTRLSLIPGILKAVEEGVVKISSLHNFCPLPIGIMHAAPNLYEPSAVSRRERILWLNNTLKTVDFAVRLGCDRVVLHSGRIRFLWGDPEPAVDAALEAEGVDGTFEKVRDKGLNRLKRKLPKFEERLNYSYGELAEKVKDAGICFGIENREGFSELPLDADMLEFQANLKEHGIFGYWHDAGHARLKERMGLLDHRKHLKALRPYLAGFHLHDVSEEGRDHCPPGSGTIDWSLFAEMIRPDDVVVLELSPRLTPGEVLGGRDFLMQTVPALRDA